MLKSFKQFINEQPKINLYHSKERMQNETDKIRSNLDHSKSNKIDIEYYHQKDANGNHYYYRHDGTKPRELSIINKDNIHQIAHKDSGNSNHIKNFIYHHVNNYGNVSSDNSNTEGSKKIWMEISKEHPKNMSLYHHNDETNSSVKIDHHYLKNNEHELWNKSNDAYRHRIILKRNDK